MTNLSGLSKAPSHDASSQSSSSSGGKKDTPGPLRQMRQGTKSCQECRRRKIKCNYPPTPPSTPSSTTEPEKKCIECTTHNRTCQIQGFVAGRASSPTSKREATSATDIGESNSSGPRPRKPTHKTRIYKRRRPVDRNSPDASDDEERPRMKMHFDRIPPVVERIAKETGASNIAHIDSMNVLSTSNSAFGDFSQDAEIQLNPGNALANALGFDIAHGGLVDSQGSDLGGGFDTFLHTGPTLGAPLSFMGGAAAWGSDGPPVSLGSHPLLPNPFDHSGVNPFLPIEEQSKKSSPLLCQLFDNEIFSQATMTPHVLTEKVQTMSFLDTKKNATDAEKLLSTLSSEPYLLDVLDYSVTWWIAWRDQAFALQDVFSYSPETQAQDDLVSAQYRSRETSNPSTSSTSPGPSAAPGRTAYSKEHPISLRDFVNLKLSHRDNPVSIATALFCVALCLQQLRCGVDDSVLNISTTPSEAAERLILAVDTVILSPTSKPHYMRDPGVMLLLMMRAKIFAESNQLRKSWLSLRRAIEVAKTIGFTEWKTPVDAGEYARKTCPGKLKKLFHRQRFVGSIMELDRLMSMVLGFPHAEDAKFTDRLAMAVLRGQGTLREDGTKPQVSREICMRALRRVVSVVAGRVNDRNASSAPDTVKQQTTTEIQQTLNEAAAAMPTGWWDVNSHLHYTDAFVAHEHLVAQMWFWQVQAFLHLPFMLKPCTNLHPSNESAGEISEETDEYFINRYLCLQGCRGMIRVFSLLRSDPSLSVYICACEDFQGVFSACILMVGALIRLAFCPLTQTGTNSDVMGNVDDDLALIQDIKDVFRYRSQQQSGGISKQGLKVLDELSSFLDDWPDFHGDQPRRRTVVLPYFGAIYLELRPPQHLRTNIAHCEVSSLKMGSDLTPPGSINPSLEGGSELEYSDVNGLVATDLVMDETSRLVVPDGSANWDQFLFGTELGQEWDADMSRWPADDALWEWS